MFEIKTGWTSNKNTDQAITELTAQLVQGRRAPDYLMVQLDATLDLDRAYFLLGQLFPNTVIHGATSCLGSMSDKWQPQDEGFGLSGFAIFDDEGSYGSAYVPLEDDPCLAAFKAISGALEDAEAEGELPDLIWVSSSPGDEEAVLEGIEKLVGSSVPIIGGSSADNDLTGKWREFSRTELGVAEKGGVVVSALFPSVVTGTAFQSAYKPTGISATVTKSEERKILELDGRPARTVYNEWMGGTLSDKPKDEITNILFDTSLEPLGREYGRLGGAVLHLLSHPETLTPDEGITLFTNIEEGDEVHQMLGTEDMLVSRPAGVLDAAKRIAEISEDVSGAIIVYCGGCMLTIEDRMADTYENINSALNGRPFITAFTFGEQGRILGEKNCHGNLMVTAVIFGQANS